MNQYDTASWQMIKKYVDERAAEGIVTCRQFPPESMQRPSIRYSLRIRKFQPGADGGRDFEAAFYKHLLTHIIYGVGGTLPTDRQGDQAASG